MAAMPKYMQFMQALKTVFQYISVLGAALARASGKEGGTYGALVPVFNYFL